MRAGDVNLTLTANIADLQAKMDAAEKGVGGFASSTGAAAKSIQQNAERMAAALDSVRAGSSGMSAGVGSAAQAAQTQAAQLGSALNSVAKASGVSAQQTAAAWRMLPQQLQDVAVSLQGGMSPFTVLMQQGPQITGAFGGVKATLSAFASAIPPVAAAGAALVAGLGAVAFAAYQGSKEQQAFTASLIATNGRIGLTADQIGTMAQRMDGLSGVTRGQASEALALMARQAGIGSDSLERMASVAIQLENAGGPAVAETAKQFASLAKDPLAASVSLNEATGFLTESIYKQIRALEARGQREQAAKVAQDAYTAAMAEQAKDMEANMGTLERMAQSVAKTAKGMWDALLNVGREDTLDQQIEKALKKVNEAQALVNKGGIKGWFGEKLDSGQDNLLAAQSELAGLQQKKAAEEAAAKAKAEAAKKVEAQIADDGAVGDKRRAIAAAQLAANLAQSKAAADAAIRAEDDKAAALAATRAAGLVSEQDAARQSLAIEQARLAAKLRLIDAEIKAEKDRPLKADDVQGQLAKQTKITDLKSQRAGVADQLRMAPISTQWKIDAADLSEARASMQQWAQMWTEADGKVRALTEQTAQAQAAMIDAPIAAAAARTDLTIAKLQADADKAKAVYQGLIDTLRANGDTSAADALAGKVQGLDQAVAAQAAAERQKVVMDYLKGSTDALGAGWDNVTRGIGGAVQAMMSLSTEQANYAAALKMAGGDQAKIAQVEQRHLQSQIASYGQMAGAAKQFFSKKTAAYKVLDAAEKASAALQMALAIKTAAEKMGLISAEVGATVAGEGAKVGAVAGGQAGQTAAVGAGESQRNALKIPGVFLSFMSSLGPWGMAAAAVAIAAVWKGANHGSVSDATEQRQAANGAGTVLGDPAAKSESISKALDSLSDVDTMTMRYSAQMSASLRNIEASMAGVATQILKAGGITTGANLGISEGTIKNVGDPLLKMSGLPGLKMLDEKVRQLPVIGKLLTSLTGLWGGTKTQVTDTGLSLSGRTSDLLAGQGGQQYADVAVTKKSWFGLSKTVTNSTVMQGLDASMTRQFGLIFAGVGDSLEAAAGALGADTARVSQQLADYVIDIPRLSLQGLSGDALQTAISNAVSAAADRMAQVIAPGLEDFQGIGEGYYETVVRVSTASEEAQQALQNLGIKVVSVGDIINKQADDIGAEIARQSILLAENGGSSITAITQTMSGSAADIASAYTSLLDVREFMRQTGFGATDASQPLLAGAGGLSSLQEGISAYVEHFATSAQKTALTTAQMTAQFERLGVSMPADAAGFSSLVHGIDTTTESGKKLLGSVLALSGSFASYLDATGQATAATRTAADIASERASLERKLLEVQGDTKAIRALDLASLDESNRALQQRIWALQDEKDRLDALAGAGKGISSLIEELRGGASTSASLAQRRAAYNSELSAAQSGDVTASNSIAATARSLIESLKATATDPLQLAMETSRIAAQLSALPAVEALAQQASDQASTALAAAAQSTSTAAAASAAAASSGTSSTAVSQSSTSNNITELSALRAAVDSLLSEVKLLRSGQDGGLEAIKANTRRTAQAIEGVIADDGVSIAVSVQG